MSRIDDVLETTSDSVEFVAFLANELIFGIAIAVALLVWMLFGRRDDTDVASLDGQRRAHR